MKSPALNLAPNWKAAVKAWFLAKFGRDASGKITLLGDTVFKLSSTLLVWVQGFRPTFIPASVVAKLATAPKLSKAEKYAQKKAQELPAVVEEVAKPPAIASAEYYDEQEKFPAGGTTTQKAIWHYKALADMIRVFAEVDLPPLTAAQALEFLCNPYSNALFCEYERYLDGCEEEEEYERVCKKYGPKLLYIIEEKVLKIPSSRGFGKR